MMSLPPNINTSLNHRSCRRDVYLVALLFTILVALASYPVGEIFRGEGWLPQSQIGNGIIAQHLVATVAMFAVWLYGPNSQKLRDYRWLIIAAIATRLILIPADVYSSNDIDRYLFDGRLWWEGYDPYRVNHETPEIQSLRALWGPPDEHAAYVTIYPPLALSLFTLAASFGVEWAAIVWKVISGLAGIGAVMVAAMVLRHANQLQHLALFALSPLLILETGIGAHLDIFSVLFICLAIWCWQTKRILQCGVWIAAGTLIKFLPLVIAMPLFLSAQNHKQRLKLTASVLATISAGYGSVIALGLEPIGSLVVFFEKWRFGSPTFNALSTLSSSKTLPLVTASILVLGMALIALYCLRDKLFSSKQIDDQQNNQRTIHAIQLALALPLLLSPVVYPWYLMPLLLFIALSPKAYLLAWLTLMPLTYEVMGQFICCANWNPAVWPLWVVAGGLLLGLIFDLKIYIPRLLNKPTAVNTL